MINPKLNHLMELNKVVSSMAQSTTNDELEQAVMELAQSVSDIEDAIIELAAMLTEVE